MAPKQQVAVVILLIGGRYFMKSIIHRSLGFTYIELLVAMAVGITIYMLFTRELTLLLQAHDQHQTRQDITQTADRILTIFTQAGQTASKFDITSGNTQLSVTGNPCRLFSFNSASKSLGYAENTSSGCVPPSSTTTLLHPTSVQVTQLQFLPLPQALNAKTVQLSFSLNSILPYASSSSSFTTTVSLWGK